MASAIATPMSSPEMSPNLRRSCSSVSQVNEMPTGAPGNGKAEPNRLDRGGTAPPKTSAIHSDARTFKLGGEEDGGSELSTERQRDKLQGRLHAPAATLLFTTLAPLWTQRPARFRPPSSALRNAATTAILVPTTTTSVAAAGARAPGSRVSACI